LRDVAETSSRLNEKLRQADELKMMVVQLETQQLAITDALTAVADHLLKIIFAPHSVIKNLSAP
jgi:hypothetical protein